jgi:hypothetical protein
MSRRFTAFGIFVLTLIVGPLSRAETYYLSRAGKDSANGTSADAPLRTLSKINELAKPGDTLILSEWIFELGKSFHTLSVAGTKDAPIRINSIHGKPGKDAGEDQFIVAPALPPVAKRPDHE